MKKYLVFFTLLLVCKFSYTQDIDWFKEEPYKILRDAEILNYKDLRFNVTLVNDSLGYYRGSYLEIYKNYDADYSYNLPELVLKNYAFDLFDIEPEDFKNKKVFKPGYTINNKAIIIARSHLHGASHVGIYYHVFQVDPVLYLGEIEWFWWEPNKFGEAYFFRKLNELVK